MQKRRREKVYDNVVEQKEKFEVKVYYNKIGERYRVPTMIWVENPDIIEEFRKNIIRNTSQD